MENSGSRPQVSKEGEEQGSDTDSGCYLISLEDEDLQEDNKSLSVIPRDNLVSGSVLGQYKEKRLKEFDKVEVL